MTIYALSAQLCKNNRVTTPKSMQLYRSVGKIYMYVHLYTYIDNT